MMTAFGNGGMRGRGGRFNGEQRENVSENVEVVNMEAVTNRPQTEEVVNEGQQVDA